MKPLIAGLIDRSKIPPLSFRGIVNAYVINTEWANLQPTSDGPLVTAHPIDAAVDYVRTVNSGPDGAGLSLKLRVNGGVGAPEWAKTIGGFSPIPVTLGSGSGTVGPFWTSQYQESWTAFQALLAADYDDTPEIREIVLGGGVCEVFVEPFNRDTSPHTVQAFQSAGYTAALDMGVLQGAISDVNPWMNSRVSMAFNPYSSVGGHLDEVFTEEMISLFRSTYGERGILENYSIRSIPQTEAYVEMYAQIKATGTPIAFQTATAEKVGNLIDTLEWAVEQGASSVELPSGYETAYTPSELQKVSEALAGNAG